MTRRIRERLGAALAERLNPKRYQIETNVTGVEKIARRRLVQIEVTSFGPGPSRGMQIVEATVHVVTHREGITEQAEDDADEAVFEVFDALEQIPWANPTEAAKSVYRESHLSYQIKTEFVTEKETTA